MASIYDSINGYFEKTYGKVDEQVSKKPFKESKEGTADSKTKKTTSCTRQRVKEAVDPERCKAILNYELDWDQVDETGDVDFAIDQLRSLNTEGLVSEEEYDYIMAHWDELLVECNKAPKKGGQKLVEGDKAHPVAQALTDAGIQMDGDISSPVAARALADKVIDVLKAARDAADKKDATQFTRAIEIINKRRNSPALLLSTLGTYYTKIKADAGSDKKDECVASEPVKECTSRRAVKEAKKRKTESLKSAPKRHLSESKKVVSRRALKESVAKYQAWVDYDTNRYHKITDITTQALKKAGLAVSKNVDGNYEVVMEGLAECSKPVKECRFRKAMKEGKKIERDLWETVYGELTDDGSQRFNKETGHTYFNKGAGYDYGTQIAVDRAGNIVVKVAEERDLKAAIDIADKHKSEGVTYTITESKYDKRFPIWMTIEIPFEGKEDLDEAFLAEKRWAYNLSDRVSREFRDAIQADDEDYERVKQAILAVYKEIHEKAPQLLDDDEYDSYVSDIEFIDPEYDDPDDVEDNLNYELSNLYDFCDAMGIWIGI